MQRNLEIFMVFSANLFAILYILLIFIFIMTVFNLIYISHGYFVANFDMMIHLYSVYWLILYSLYFLLILH